MKKYVNMIALLVVLCMVFALPVSAEIVIMRGYTDPSAKGVSILITKTPVEKENIKSDDIVWVDQQSINADGSFVISVPLFTQEGYIIHSNAQEFTEKTTADRLTLYVSKTGTGNGFDAENPSNLDKVYDMLGSLENVTIILTESITYSAPRAYSGKLTIRGNDSTQKLTLPDEVVLKGDLTIDNLTLSGNGTIYACGHELVITEKVTPGDSEENLTVYGGNKGSNLTGDTSLKLYGAQYAAVYGGCLTGTVTGDTNVILGGVANKNHETGDNGTCKVYGGGYKGSVTGKTNVTIEGEAKAQYIYGAGTGTGGTATDTNINIAGGNVMNVYGGSTSVVLTGCNTHINMTGGTAEALFGGCSAASMTGNTYISVKGGEVTRRIYGGCYNEAIRNGLKLEWKSEYYVKGTTNIFLYPGKDIVTGNESNRGIFGGSRRESKATGEINTIFFMDGSYDSLKGMVGEQDLLIGLFLKSFHDYMVDSAVGGTVLPDEAGYVKVSLPQGKSALSGGNRYFDGQTIALTNKETEIKYDGIESATATRNEAGVNTNVEMLGSTTGKLLAAIYDGEDNFITCSFASVNEATKLYDIPLTCKLDPSKDYNIRFFFWDSNEKLVPVTTVYSLKLR